MPKQIKENVMSDFITKCPQCGMEVSAKQEWIGMTVACPGCQRNFTIQQPGAPVPPPPPQQGFGQPQMPGMNVPPPPQQGYGQPYGAAPAPTGINVTGSNWYVDYNEAMQVKKYYTIMWILMAAGLLTCGLTTIAGFVFMYILLYKFWKFIPYQESYYVTTPGKAVGFCFIPFFSFYWIFVAFRKLAEFYQRYTATPIVTYATVMCACVIAQLLPYIGGIASIGAIVFFFMLFNELKNIVVALGNNCAANYGAPSANGYTNY